MINYIKSECYRMRKSSELYLVIAVLGGLTLAMNILLAVFGWYTGDLRYSTVRFSLNTFTASIYIMVMLAAVVSGVLFIEDRKNGVLKNIVAYGLDREKLFVGKCIAAFLHTFFVMCVVLVIYVGSAYLLLEDREWLPLREMLTGIAALLPVAAGSLICMMVFGMLCRKEMIASVLWMAVYYAVPMAVELAGMKIPVFARISSWLPYTFIRSEAVVRYADYNCLWDTSAGFAKCVISGVLGIVIFLMIGVWRFRKQEF